MKRRTVRKYFSLIFLLGLLVSPALETGATEPVYQREEVSQRLEELPCLIQPRHTSAVDGYIKGYVLRRKEKTEAMLGRMLTYFPLFEHFLRQHRLPEELKYLAIVESALNPTAVSSAGAAGLWQFMPETGRSYGLRINRYVDERLDPWRSTEAAMRHLAKQYDRFGSWELALAAYNSGAGRVHRAMRAARSRNFWRLMRYLPRETRNYVPAFIAATYLVHHFADHRLQPQLPPSDLQFPATVEVRGNLSLKEIAELLRLPYETMQLLNPAYKKGFIPQGSRPYTLTVPRRLLPALQHFLSTRRPDALPDYKAPAVFLLEEEISAPPYESVEYRWEEGDELLAFADALEVSPWHLRLWNGKGPSWAPQPGEKVRLLVPAEHPIVLAPRRQGLLVPASLPTPPLQPLPLKNRSDSEGDFLFFFAEPGETTRILARKLGVDLDAFCRWNDLQPNQLLDAGRKVRVRAEALPRQAPFD